MRKRIRWVLLLIAALIAAGWGCDNGADDDDDQGDDDADDDNDDDDTSDDDTADDDTSADDDTNVDDDTSDEVEVFLDGDTLVIRNNALAVRYLLNEGRYNILDKGGTRIVRHAEALILSHSLLPEKVWHGSELPYLDWSSQDVSNALGSGKSIKVRRGGVVDAPTIEQTFALLEGESLMLADVNVVNDTKEKMLIGAIYPLSATPPDGALIFGRNRDLRTLTDGTLNYGDFCVPISPGTLPSISNWSTLIYNQTNRRSLLLGFLAYDVSQPVIYNGPDRDPNAGQALQADCQYDPAKSLTVGGHLKTEPMILDFGQSKPFEVLETYADRLKTWLNIQTWTERHPEIGVPAGWNSWSGGGGSGGYGTGIDEQIIVDNMDFADRELRRWGMNYFQIDDGWQVKTGDWEVNATKFPDHGDQNGIEWLISRANNLGFLSGVWIAAMWADGDAQVVLDHPDWWAYPLLYELTGDTTRYLDDSNPDALAHLTDLMETLKSWGVQWLKLDFAYRGLISQDWQDESLTRGEFYRRGIQTIQEALGPDIFFINVAVVGFNYGLVDSIRLTLDTMPVWEGESSNPYSPIAIFDNQGLKPMYRDSARRYYLHERTWINHPDLIFFRAHSNPEYDPLTLNESATFTTAVALQGGLVKLGDRLVDLSAEAVGVIRSVLPVYGHAGRPLDMFEREFPEVWVLKIDDFTEPYYVLGLLNWGINRDLTTDYPFEFIPDTNREIGADFAEAGILGEGSFLAFEFWTQEFLGEVTDELFVDVPARTPRVIALRPKLDHPQFLGTNRHVLGGVGVVRSIEWDWESWQLTGTQEGAIGTDFAPFTNTVTFYLPGDYYAESAEVTAPDGYEITNQTLVNGEYIATLSFDVERTGAAVDGDQHPDVTWTVQFD